MLENSELKMNNTNVGQPHSMNTAESVTAQQPASKADQMNLL
jgi:hypothetical protein